MSGEGQRGQRMKGLTLEMPNTLQDIVMGKRLCSSSVCSASPYNSVYLVLTCKMEISNILTSLSICLKGCEAVIFFFVHGVSFYFVNNLHNLSFLNRFPLFLCCFSTFPQGSFFFSKLL